MLLRQNPRALRFRRFNSFALLREFARKDLICRTVFAVKQRLSRRNLEIPGFDVKEWEFCF
jgi:hypothetical protein